MRSYRFRAFVVSLFLAAVLSMCVGCEPVSFAAGFVAGRLSGNTAQITTIERNCFQNGVQVPCP